MKRVIIAILVLAAAASCRKSELQVEENGKINLSTAVAGFDEHFPQRPAETQSRAASKTTSASKAEATDFPIGQTLGLYLHTDNPIGTAASCHSQNIEYATPDGGATWNQRASLDAPLGDGTTYYATAYSPFVEGAFEPTAMALAVATDQSTGDALERSDLRIARNTPIAGAGNTFTATLDFTHALAMFELKLLIPQMVEGREVDQIETITFENMATKGTINLATGAITTDLNSVATVRPRIVSGTGLIGVMTTYQAIVVPQNVDGNVLLAKIRCRMKDGSTETMDYVTPSRGWVSFRSGVKTSITLMPTAEAAFMGDLPELMDGQAHTDLALPIFVETGLRWTIDAPGCPWLTLADAAGGTYGDKLSGTSTTGAWQNIFVKVSANTAQTMPRTGDLLLRAWRADGSEVPAAVLRLVQNYYAFSPVGGTWNTLAAAAADPVQPFASNQQWTAETDAAWLLLATSANPGSGNPTRKFTQVGALEADKLFVQVLANNSADARRGVVTISSPVAGSAPMKIYVNQMGNQPYVELGGLRWATGNLVAMRSSVDGVSAPGCMIGAPDDGGLYFQFGSLIGYKGGAADYQGAGNKIPDASMSDKWWNGAAAWSWANDAMVWPSNLSGTPSAWPQSATTNQWYFGLQSGWSTAGQTIRDYPGLVTGSLSTAGVGDPCTYYLGGTWRLPTATEHQMLCNNKPNEAPWADAGGAWVSSPVEGGYLAGAKLFFPASGFRHTTNNGAFAGLFIRAYCSGSLIGNNTLSHSLAGNPTVVYPWYGNDRSRALPVRCVQPVPTVPNPPAESDYVEINGLYWTKGNLVATNNTNAKVGKPEDGGLYFQFGSLIGYKGGATANGGTGVGIPDASFNSKYWGGATAWNWGNDTGLWPDKLEGQPTAWPQGATTNQWYFGVQSGWSTTEQNIRDYSGLTAGNLADKGVGDPCTYYLGNPWRLPTSLEYKAMCNNQGGYQVVNPFASCNATWITSPIVGGDFAGTKLFFPASGDRNATNGSFHFAGIGGYYWSSSIYTAPYGVNFCLVAAGVYSQGWNARTNGFPVRCVSSVPHKPNPPAPSDYVEINGLKWAKGNLVASSSHNAKVGKPEDGGLYFQFGSLIGYKGGALANGGTGVGANPYTGNGTQWWGGAAAYSWANDAMVWPSEMSTTPSAWPSNNGSTAGDRNTVVDQWFFNYNTAPYSTTGQDMRGFSGSFSGDKGTGNLGTGRYAKWGVGDPCTYYLGGTWRLPTTNEIAAVCNNQGGGSWLSWATVGGSWTTSPTSGGNFSSNKLFFPASGYRDLSNGSFNTVTTSGNYWSSSVNNATYGHHLYFNQPNGVIPQDDGYRSYGFSVRCVGE